MNPVRNIIAQSQSVNDSVKSTEKHQLRLDNTNHRIYEITLFLNLVITNRHNPTRGKQCREVKTTAEIMKTETINNK